MVFKNRVVVKSFMVRESMFCLKIKNEVSVILVLKVEGVMVWDEIEVVLKVESMLSYINYFNCI